MSADTYRWLCAEIVLVAVRDARGIPGACGYATPKRQREARVWLRSRQAAPLLDLLHLGDPGGWL